VLVLIGLVLFFAGGYPQLQISHIACWSSTTVEVHIVLVHSADSDGAPVRYTLNGQPQTAYWQNFTGDTNHYSDYFSQTVPTTYTITAASVVYSGTLIAAHNLPFEIKALDCHPTAIGLSMFAAQPVFQNSDIVVILLIVAAGLLIFIGRRAELKWREK